MEKSTDKNKVAMKTEKVCRTCLIDEEAFLEISHAFDEVTLAQMIQDITNLQVNPQDGYTQSVCFKCVEEIKRAHSFRRKCIESNCALIKLKSESSMAEWVDKVSVFNQAAEEPTEVKEESDDDCNLADFVKIEYGEGDDQSCKINSSTAENNYDNDDYDDGEDSESDEPLNLKFVKNDKKENKISYTIFDCHFCHGLFSSYNVFNKHLHKFHLDKIKNINDMEKREPLGYIIKEKSEQNEINIVYKCARNDFVGKTLVELKTHIHEHMGDKPITCTDCDYRTTGIELLRNHISQKHTEGKIYSCPECIYSCKSQNALKKHSIIHTTERTYHCPFCPKTFKIGSSLSRHKKEHGQRKDHVCNICQKAFFQSTSLKSHMLVHTGERPHICHYCGMGFSQAGILKNHILVMHLPANEIYKCDHCEYTTKLKYKITLHTKKHFAEKKFQCSHCSFRTKTNGCLKAHMKTHFGIEKKYSCDMCDYKCTRFSRLEIHKKDHTGERPFPCNICSYSGKSKHALERHSQTHSTELKFVCHNCPFRTNTRDVLQKHLRNKCIMKKRGRRPSRPTTVVETRNDSIV